MNRYFYQFPRFTTCVVIGAVFLFLGAWAWLTSEEWAYEGGRHLLKGLGSAVGIAGYVLFSLSLFLSSRWKKLEDWIGGLDQVYHLHHRMGMWGFYLILAHPLILALRWLPQQLDRFFLFIFPIHHRLSVNLGSYAFWLMLFIIGITILKLLPYDKWKLTHKFMALVFVLASLHFLLSERRFDDTFPSLALLFIPMGLGLFGIIYKQVLMPYFFHHPTYHVIRTKKINDNVIMITLKPEEQPLGFIPGQYAFFSFGGKLSREQHPFTVCNAQESSISILAKVRGDFTRSLYSGVCPGDHAILEGPYGRFDYTRGSKDQVWIAGGIGIAPFLAWCQTLAKWQGNIDLFYCFHREEDALFLEEFQRVQKEAVNFNYHTYCSEKKQRLTVEDIKDAGKKDIFMCGPRRLTNPFVKHLERAGVKRSNIHFEDFEFF